MESTLADTFFFLDLSLKPKEFTHAKEAQFISLTAFLVSLINAFAETDSVFSHEIPIPSVRIAQGETGILCIFSSLPSKNIPGSIHTSMFPYEPGGFLGSHNMMDSKNIPYVITPNQCRDGGIHSLL